MERLIENGCDLGLAKKTCSEWVARAFVGCEGPIVTYGLLESVAALSFRASGFGCLIAFATLNTFVKPCISAPSLH